MLEKKLNVIGYDKNKTLLSQIRTGKFKSKEISIQKLYKKNLPRIHVINKLEKSDIFFICVPTPIKKNKKADISYVVKAIDEIAKVAEEKNCIIIESTCPPQTTQQMRKRINLKNLMFAYCPERVLPGNTFNEMKNNIKIIGGVNQSSTTYVETFYKNLGVKKLIKTNDIEAELIKLTENSFRDTSIAFANEISSISEKYNVDAKKIIRLANTHPRVAIPFPGIGVGGHCIPVDPYFLIDKKYKSNLIKISRKINDSRPKIIAKKIINLSNSFRAKFKKSPKILLLGKSYKANIDDIRNSPAIEIFKIIKKNNRPVTIFDPLTDNKKISKEKISKFDLIFELVPHDKFKFLKKNKKINLINF